MQEFFNLFARPDVLWFLIGLIMLFIEFMGPRRSSFSFLPPARGQSIVAHGGRDAVNLRITEQYIQEFGKLAKPNNTMLISTNLADLSSIIATATTVIANQRGEKP
ncbi:MAG: band-7 C-terminal domain-containing protein [Desulfomonilia bacterium]|jgi:hypothetical protein|nr:band-7 C-terminal domain-containing protein [Desulfomonilia bacterium]